MQKTEFIWIVIILLATAALIVYIIQKQVSPPTTPSALLSSPPTLTPANRPGTGWYNEWLMERPLNLDYEIKH